MDQKIPDTTAERSDPEQPDQPLAPFAADPFDDDSEHCRICGCTDEHGCVMAFKDADQRQAFIARYEGPEGWINLTSIDIDGEDVIAAVCWWFANGLCVACAADLDVMMASAAVADLEAAVEILKRDDHREEMDECRDMRAWELPTRHIDAILHEMPALLERWAKEDKADVEEDGSANPITHLPECHFTAAQGRVSESDPVGIPVRAPVGANEVLPFAPESNFTVPQFDAHTIRDWFQNGLPFIRAIHIEGPLLDRPLLFKDRPLLLEYNDPGRVVNGPLGVGVDHGDRAGHGVHVVVQYDGATATVVSETVIPPRLEPLWLRDDEGTIHGLSCPKCGRLTAINSLVGRDDPYLAVDCCDPRCNGCGVPVAGQHTRRCPACERIRLRTLLEKQYRSGRKVHLADYIATGLMVYLDNGDRFVNADELPDDSGAWWGFGTKRYDFSLDADDILESALDDHHEDASSDISRSEVVRLQGLLDAWVKDNPVSSYEPDFGTIVIFTQLRIPATVKCTACLGNGGSVDHEEHRRAREDCDFTPDAGWAACKTCNATGSVTRERTEDGGFMCPRCDHPITARDIHASLQKFATMIICPNCAVCQHSHEVTLPGLAVGGVR